MIKVDIVLNSKAEWNGSRLPRIVIEDRDVRIEDKENGATKMDKGKPGRDCLKTVKTYRKIKIKKSEKRQIETDKDIIVEVVKKRKVDTGGENKVSTEFESYREQEDQEESSLAPENPENVEEQEVEVFNKKDEQMVSEIVTKKPERLKINQKPDQNVEIGQKVSIDKESNKIDNYVGGGKIQNNKQAETANKETRQG